MKKIFKLSFLVAISAIVMAFTGNAFAYHDGGVAKCDGCHTMHNSYKGAKMSVTGAALIGNAYLLKGSDPSSTCLNCHGKSGATTPSGYYICSTDAGVAKLPVQRTPGGDFGWLFVNGLSNADVVQAGTEATNRHGHHIVAADFNMAANTDNGGIAPGSSSNYPAAQLGCNSCHDPHQNVRGDGSHLPISISGSYGQTPATGTATGVYRLLGGVGYQLANTPTVFTAAAPVAVAPSTYNLSDTTYTGTRVAYGKGMSEWCANCHDQMLNNSYTLGSAGGGAAANHKHPAGNSSLLSTVLSDGSVPATIYNAYVNTGNGTGVQASSYLSIVPYEMQDTTVADLNTAITSTAGPTGGENVMCLSCHRAHATGFDSMTRFPVNETQFLTDDAGNYAYINAAHAPADDTTGYMLGAMYDRPASQWGLDQRTLCNKCHGKDQ